MSIKVKNVLAWPNKVDVSNFISKVGVFLCPQVKLVSELGKIEASFQELDKMKVKRDVAQYSIEIIELL